MKKKVCVITTSLGKGGAEKSSAILTQILSKLKYQVHILVTKDIVDYKFSGTLFNLEREMEGYPSSLKKVVLLRNYFKEQRFDVIIDNRSRLNFFKEYFLYHYIFKADKIITMVHSYFLRTYFPDNPFLAKIIFKKNFAFVAVSAEIKKAIQNNYGFYNVYKINNTLDFETIDSFSNPKQKVLGFKYILWYGRVVNRVKNLSLLLESYQKSFLVDSGVKLIIMGDGEDLESIKQKANNMNLNNHVAFLPYTVNPYPYVKNAFFTVLTSYHEGFPMSILESLACQTPVVSVDCKSGPNEIIRHEYNGLLVENHNSRALADAFNKFLENKLLYEKCKLNTRESVGNFTLDEIGVEWIKLIEKA